VPILGNLGRIGAPAQDFPSNGAAHEAADISVVVQCADNGEMALEVCRSGIGEPDAIIIDEFMPVGGKMLGHEVVQMLRAMPNFNKVSSLVSLHSQGWTLI